VSPGDASGEFQDLEEFAIRLVDAWGNAVAAYLERLGPLVRSLAELADDPQVRAAVAAREFGKVLNEYRPCHCLCGHAHPEARGICSTDAVTSRRYDSPALGPVDVPLCAPCAVAQGIEVSAER
jgi:hypothetical protein